MKWMIKSWRNASKNLLRVLCFLLTTLVGIPTLRLSQLYVLNASFSDITTSLQHKQHEVLRLRRRASSQPGINVEDHVDILAEPQLTQPLWRRVTKQFWWNENLLQPFINSNVSFFFPICPSIKELKTLWIATSIYTACYARILSNSELPHSKRASLFWVWWKCSCWLYCGFKTI